MKKVILILCFLLFSVGCANNALNKLKEIEKQNSIGEIKAYQEISRRQYNERIDVEKQFIDMQLKFTFLINAYAKFTGISVEKMKEKEIFSLSEAESIEKKFNDIKKNRLNKINLSYSKAVKNIEMNRKSKLKNKINVIEHTREETKKTFMYGIKKIFGLVSR